MESQAPGTERIRLLAEKAARVQDVLQDLEVALLRTGDKGGLRLIGELKRAWRGFKDEAMRGGDGGPSH